MTFHHSCLILILMESVFDPLKFYDELKAAEVPEKQARAQAEVMRNAFAAYDASKMKELATKGDLREVELRILKWVIGAIITQTALIIAVIGNAVAILIK